MEHHSIGRSAVTIFTQNFVSESFRQKRGNFQISMEQIRQSSLPTALLNIDALSLQTYSEDPFAYCLAALATS